MAEGKRVKRYRPGRLCMDRRKVRVAELHAAGYSPEEMAREVVARLDSIRRDLSAMRGAARHRRPWVHRSAARAFYIEASEALLQKVRRAQGRFKPDEEPNQRLVNLFWLEWAMLDRFLTRLEGESDVKTQRMEHERKRPEQGEKEGERAYARRCARGLLEQARQLGLDTRRFEKALRAAGAFSADGGRADAEAAGGADREGGGEAKRAG